MRNRISTLCLVLFKYNWHSLIRLHSRIYFLKISKKKSLVWSHYPSSHILLWIYFSLTTSTTVSTIKIKTRSFSIQLLRKANWLANTSSSKSVIQIKLNAPIDIDMLEKPFSFSLLKLESIFFGVSWWFLFYIYSNWLIISVNIDCC